ncbi:DUF2520 domain-containing protein [Arenibacter aquaticus]|uniref:DUF2520 domain-containing protein n=1 Tax=Arenibacter aquaticus TaxID=2489054 RepID=A0A3S0IKG3_9FLAO|nr:Rossmann-like and DUF2520 domain-containing protein [Arenibacter aquaticus]RTE52212.1 DUF2520 domain-containing protein [Arenibacter aquaticus]
MISIVIVGTGNVAKHLFRAFVGIKEIEVVQVIGRTATKLLHFSEIVPVSVDFTKIVEADLYLMAVSDNAIPEVSHLLKNKKGLVVHTSGGVSITAMGDLERKGVFYPLQSFSAEKDIDFKTVPICIEAQNDKDLLLLNQLGKYLSQEVQVISSEQRKTIHLAAVYVNNFTNHLFQIGHEICSENNIPFSILTPLIKETVNKLDYLLPSEAQTGPAKRKDTKTMEIHLKQLKDKNYKDIYSLLSKSISEKYG